MHENMYVHISHMCMNVWMARCCARKLQRKPVSHFFYIVLHFITFILQSKRFLPFPRKGSLNIHGLMLNKHVLTRDLGEQVIWDVTWISLSCRWFLWCLALGEICLLHWLECFSAELGSCQNQCVEAVQVSLVFCSIKPFFLDAPGSVFKNTNQYETKQNIFLIPL